MRRFKQDLHCRQPESKYLVIIPLLYLAILMTSQPFKCEETALHHWD